MKVATIQHRVAPIWGIFILGATILVTGCASYSHTDVPTSNAANVLRVGDEVEITRKDDTTAYFKVEEISDAEVSGSLLTNMFGRNVSIPFTDIASITLYTKDGHDSQQSAEIIGGVLGLALFFSLL